MRIHLAGFFWGDCSLSNALFRRDAGTLSAYLVDAETGDLHPQLSTGQRSHDLQIAEENVAGELLDLEAAQVGLPSGLDPLETAAEVPRRYEALWSELTREDVFGPDETYRIDERLRRLNGLGFDVEEVQLVGDAGGQTLRLNPQVVEPGHHRRRLHTLTGLDVQENQARRLLNDLATFRATGGRSAAPESVVAYRWLTECFEPSIAAVPADLRGKREAAELFHEILEHRWFLSEAAQRDVGMPAAVDSYIDDVLRHRPDEKAVLTPEAEESSPEDDL